MASSSVSQYVSTDLCRPLVQHLLCVVPGLYATRCSLFLFFLFIVLFLLNPRAPTIILAPREITISAADSTLTHAINSAVLPPFPLAPPPPPSSSSSSSPGSTSLDVHLAPPAAANLSAAADRPAANEGKIDGGEKKIKNKDLASCDIFDGRWVLDESSPMYPPGSCPFIDSSFDCFSNGRLDLGYTKLRWKPKGCTIPRLEGKNMLKLLKGKRLAFVGDSLNRNMWESLVCILRHSLTNKSRLFEASGRKEFRTDNAYAFKFPDYNCSIEFFRSPFLVQETSTPDSNGTSRETLRLDLMEAPSSEAYKNADIIVFNSGHWWTHDKTSKGFNFYQEGDRVIPRLSAEEAYHKALRTWARWVETHVDRNHTQVFFRGYSWSHFNGGQWNSGGNCDKETQPITEEEHLAKYLKLTSILESVMREMRSSTAAAAASGHPVEYLNITRMTDYRKDAHPSVYRLPAAMRKPDESQDCSHWCLPGVPDAWNELLYAMLSRSSTTSLAPPAD